MNVSNSTLKAELFRSKLIIAGQVAEVYLENWRVGDARRQRICHLIFENLGLASAFIISPSTTIDKPMFAQLAMSLDRVIDELKVDLQHLNREKPSLDDKRAWRAALDTIELRLTPEFSNLMFAIGFVPAERGVWLTKVMETATPLTKDGEFKRWRTFVRNLDFAHNMQSQGLRIVSAGVKLGSAQGKQEAPGLWRDCFDSTSDEGLRGRPFLPTGLTVRSTGTGLLEVSGAYDHRKVLKKELANVPTVAPDVAKRVEPMSFCKTCDYLELPAVVDEFKNWVQTQTKFATETKELVAAQAKQTELAALQAKLTSTFTPAELALLGTLSNIPSGVVKAKAPPRPRAAKSSK